MSDLISRSELIKELNKYCGNQRYLVSENIREIINNQPTAYDIDKVVEELEELDVKSITRYKNGNFGDFDGVEYYIKKREAIEIVKQGGYEENKDDVCEWIKYDYRTICPKNHDANNPYWRIPDNTDKLKYCPYCGKKIKVVD